MFRSLQLVRLRETVRLRAIFVDKPLRHEGRQTSYGGVVKSQLIYLFGTHQLSA